MYQRIALITAQFHPNVPALLMSGSIVQQLREKGFRASLTPRGVPLKLLSTGQTYTGLVQLLTPASGEFTLDPPLAMSAALHFLRSNAPVALAAVQIGDVFVDEAAKTGYRVKRIEDQPANVAIVFHTEAFHDETLTPDS